MAVNGSKHKKSCETLLKIDGVDLEKERPLHEFDEIVREHFGAVCGIDEAGRGPVAGPMVAAAVLLDPSRPIKGINDSKKLTPERREELYEEIRLKAISTSAAFVYQDEIDKTDILTADLKAMQTAFINIGYHVGIILVDGDVLPEGFTVVSRENFGGIAKNVIGGDAKSEAIAAASIIAKVSRDRFMCEIAEKYPEYGFEKHKGYGTKAHYAAIEKYGLCPLHRRTFLKKYIKDEPTGNVQEQLTLDGDEDR